MMKAAQRSNPTMNASAAQFPPISLGLTYEAG